MSKDKNDQFCLMVSQYLIGMLYGALHDLIMKFLFNQDFGRIVKFYNRIATALVKFENLWLSLWKSRVDSACGGLKVSLLAYHPQTRQLLVNADGR